MSKVPVIISAEIAPGVVEAGSQYTVTVLVEERTMISTLELNRWTLFGQWLIRDGEEDIDTFGEALSGESGDFDTAQEFSIPIEGTAGSVTLLFSSLPEDGYPVDFTVRAMRGGTEVKSQSFVGNAEKSVTISGANTATSLDISVSKWSLPSRRVRGIKIKE